MLIQTGWRSRQIFGGGTIWTLWVGGGTLAGESWSLLYGNKKRKKKLSLIMGFSGGENGIQEEGGWEEELNRVEDQLWAYYDWFSVSLSLRIVLLLFFLAGIYIRLGYLLKFYFFSFFFGKQVLGFYF